MQLLDDLDRRRYEISSIGFRHYPNQGGHRKTRHCHRSLVRVSTRHEGLSNVPAAKMKRTLLETIRMWSFKSESLKTADRDLDKYTWDDLFGERRAEYRYNLNINHDDIMKAHSRLSDHTFRTDLISHDDLSVDRRSAEDAEFQRSTTVDIRKGHIPSEDGNMSQRVSWAKADERLGRCVFIQNRWDSWSSCREVSVKKRFRWRTREYPYDPDMNQDDIHKAHPLRHTSSITSSSKTIFHT